MNVRSRTTRLLVGATLAAFAFLPLAAQAQQSNVSIVEGSSQDAMSWKFEPAEITVAAGTTVTWRNNGSQVHTATADDGSFDSQNMNAGATWQHRFDTPGEYGYHCTPHPWMTGIVKVTGGGGTPQAEEQPAAAEPEPAQEQEVAAGMIESDAAAAPAPAPTAAAAAPAAPASASVSPAEAAAATAPAALPRTGFSREGLSLLAVALLLLGGLAIAGGRRRRPASPQI